jgi:hypothetical protein
MVAFARLHQRATKARECSVRRFVLAIFVALCVVVGPSFAAAGTFNVQCLFVGDVSPQIAELLRLYPNGGPALANAIARAVEADISLAHDAVFAARGANPHQKKAIGSGLRQAARQLADCGVECRKREQILLTALRCADPETRAAFESREVEERPEPFNSGAGWAGARKGLCVSPSRRVC